MKLVQMVCENCGATLNVNEELEKVTCSYCGSEMMIVDEASKIKRVEDAKLKARKENHEQSLKERDDLLQQEIKERKIIEAENEVENFKKGKLSKALLICFAIAILFFFVGEGFLLKFLIIVQAASLLSSWLMGMKIIKEPVKGLMLVLAIIGFVLFIPILGTGGSTN